MVIPQETNGWHRHGSTETYDRETIFDYINGAGEVYLSYGFHDVRVYRFNRPGHPEIAVEVFDMGSPEDAYGVFSYAREDEKREIGQGYEYRGSVLCFWQNRFFVCVTAEEETPESKETILSLSETVAGSIPFSAGKPDLVAHLPERDLIPNSIRFFHTHTTLNYHYFLAEDNILQLSGATDAVLAAYDPGYVHLLCIRYPSSSKAQEAHTAFLSAYMPEVDQNGAARLADDRWGAAAQQGRYVVVVLDAPSKDRAEQLVSACKMNLTKSNS